MNIFDCYPHGGVCEGETGRMKSTKTSPSFFINFVLLCRWIIGGVFKFAMLTGFKLLLNTIPKGQVPIIDGSLKLHDEVKLVRYELCYDFGDI